MSPEDLRRKAQALEICERRSFRGVAALMFLAAAGYALIFYFIPGVVQRIGSSLTLAGYFYSAYEIRKRWPVRRLSAGPASGTAAAYRAQLARQRDLLQAYWKILILPFMPGPAIFVMGFLVPMLGIARAAALTALLIVSPLWIIPLCRKEARGIQREIDTLDSLMGRA